MSRSFSQGMTELSSPADPAQVSNAPIAFCLAHRPHQTPSSRLATPPGSRLSGRDLERPGQLQPVYIVRIYLIERAVPPAPVPTPSHHPIGRVRDL